MRSRPSSFRLHPSVFILFAVAALFVCATTAALAKPKKALKDSEARRAIANAPGFALNSGAVRVRNVSLAGETPVVVTAEVELAILLRRAAAEPESNAPGGWRAEEFRSGDRSWERFDWFALALDYRHLEGARVAVQSLALEFEAKQLARQKKKDAPGEAGAGAEADPAQRDEKSERAEKSGGEEQSADTLEVRRGSLRMTELAPISSSARAVVFVEASFELERGADKKWRVVAVTVGDETIRDLDRVLAAVNNQKAGRARAELETVQTALEAFRRERGFYVVAEEHTVLVDHLSPRYLTTIIRVDPWHRPYRYEGTRERYTLRSDGADGQPGTADDVTVGG